MLRSHFSKWSFQIIFPLVPSLSFLSPLLSLSTGFKWSASRSDRVSQSLSIISMHVLLVCVVRNEACELLISSVSARPSSLCSTCVSLTEKTQLKKRPNSAPVLTSIHLLPIRPRSAQADKQIRPIGSAPHTVPSKGGEIAVEYAFYAVFFVDFLLCRTNPTTCPQPTTRPAQAKCVQNSIFQNETELLRVFYLFLLFCSA